MSPALLEWLARASVMVTLLVPIAWFCGILQRRLFGARAACAAWILVLPALMPPISFLAGVTPLPIARLAEPVRLDAIRVAAEGTASGWLSPLLTLIWLGGGLGLGLAMTFRQRRFESGLHPCHQAPPEATRQRIRLAELGLPERVPVNISHAVPGPMVVGVFPPRLYLPAREHIPDEILAHEIAHLRHGDPLWRLVASMLRCIFWFLPWIHLAWKEFGKAQELAADEAVIARLDRNGRYRYAKLLAAAYGVGKPRPALGWFTHSLMKERIKMIGNEPFFSRSLRPALVLVGAVAVSITVAIASPASERDGDLADRLSYQSGDQPTDQLAPENAEAKAKIRAMHEREPLEGDTLTPVVRVLPKYPRQAAEEGLTGQVTMEATLTENGQVVDIEVIDSEPEGVFDSQAVQAFSQWRIAPVSPGESGTPEPVRIRQVMEFVLD